MLARPGATAPGEPGEEGGEGGAAAVAVSDEALAVYTSGVLKALFSTEISKQLGTDRTYVNVSLTFALTLILTLILSFSTEIFKQLSTDRTYVKH